MAETTSQSHLHPSDALSQLSSAGVQQLNCTSTCWGLLTPLAVGLALGCGRALHGVAFVAGETHNIIVVEAVTSGAAVDRAARVTACDR